MNRFVSSNAGSKQEKIRLRSLGTRMIHLFVLIGILVATLRSCNVDAADSLKLTSSFCVLQLTLTHSFNIGDEIKCELIRCICDCNDHTASRYFWQAKENNKHDCERLINHKTGQCIEKSQNNVMKSKCPDGGFAYCLLKFIAGKTFEIKVVKVSKITIRLVTENNEYIELDLDQEQFIYKNRTYEINGIKCAIPPGNQFVYFKRGNEQWIELSQFSDDFIPFFILSDDKKIHDYIRSKITIKDSACSDDTSGFALSSELQLQRSGQKIWADVITKYSMISNNTLEIFYHNKPNIREIIEIESSPRPELPSTYRNEIVSNLTTQVSSSDDIKLNISDSNKKISADEMTYSNQSSPLYISSLINVILISTAVGLLVWYCVKRNVKRKSECVVAESKRIVYNGRKQNQVDGEETSVLL